MSEQLIISVSREYGSGGRTEAGRVLQTADVRSQPVR